MKDKWVKVQKDQTVVLLDIELTSDLIHEGIANDIKRAIQILRKKCNYEINDHIMIWIWTDNIADVEHVCDMAKTKMSVIDRNMVPFLNFLIIYEKKLCAIKCMC